MFRRHLVVFAALMSAVSGSVLAQAKDIRIAHIYSKTGPLEAYGKQTQTGLMMGLEYATGGTMQVAGRKIVVIEKDDQGKPDLGKNLLAAAYGDDKVDLAVGPTASPVALAMLPVAEEYKKILLVEPAVADSITGDKWNKYIFRTGRNSSQDAIANAVAVDKEGVSIVTMAQDSAFGRDGVKAFRDAIKKAKLVHEEYLPPATTDFTAGGFSAAMALVTALKKTNGDTNTNKLISTMEGMSFDTPKGKMTFRKEDHQAMQSMYHFRIKIDPAFAWGVPELIREIKAEEMNVPIRNKR